MHTHILYIYLCAHLHAHTHRAVIVVLNDHLTFATSVLAFFLINVLYFLAAYVLQKVTIEVHYLSIVCNTMFLFHTLISTTVEPPLTDTPQQRTPTI